jgi:putative membrane protein
VPFEEYLCFALQTVLTGLIVLLVARRVTPPAPPAAGPALRAVGAAALLLVALAGVIGMGAGPTRYLGLITVWAGPVLALQWGFGGDLLLARWRLTVPAIAIPTLYLWFADRIAIGLGTWWFDPGQITGTRLLGLPVEEAAFFLVTNTLIVFGMTLVLHPVAWSRFRVALRGGVKWWRGVLALWALAMTPVPLIPDAFVTLAHVSTGLLALGVFGYALDRFGRRAWTLWGASLIAAWTIEWLGSTTGWPFGPYEYLPAGPALLGVPLLVPAGWVALAIIALGVTPGRGKVLLAPLALVAWDLGLDPLMVDRGFWQWLEPGPYYTGPLSNFAGWYVAGVLLLALMVRIEPGLKEIQANELRAVYAAQAFLMSGGLVLFGLPGAALATLAAMTVYAVVAWRRWPAGEGARG